MNWRWLLWDFADPALPLTRWHRLRMLWKPLWRTLPSDARRRRWLYTGAVALVAAVVFLVWLMYLETQGNYVPLWHLLVWMLLMVAAIWIGGAASYGLLCRREQFHRLRLEGYDVCVKCGYWLRGLNEQVAKCPECGAERESMPEVDR